MTHTIIIGTREFTCVRMNAFAANKLLMRLQKIVVPILGSLVGGAKTKSLLDIDVKEAASLLSEHLNETLMETIVFPMFAEARVYSAENKKFIKAGSDIDQCFTTENLFDLYILIFEVARYQFGPFFESLVSRFGDLTGEKNASQQSQDS